MKILLFLTLLSISHAVVVDVTWAGNCNSNQGFAFTWAAQSGGANFQPDAKMGTTVPCDEYFEIAFSFVDAQNNVISFPAAVPDFYGTGQKVDQNGNIVVTLPAEQTGFGAGYISTTGATTASTGAAFSFLCPNGVPNILIRTNYMLTALNAAPLYVRTLDTVVDGGNFGVGTTTQPLANPPSAAGIGQTMCNAGTVVAFQFPAIGGAVSPTMSTTPAPPPTSAAAPAPTSAPAPAPTSAPAPAPTTQAPPPGQGVTVLFPNKQNLIAAPMRAIYIDFKSIDYNVPSNTLFNASAAGYNVIILAFYLSASGPADMALVWQGVDPATQQATMAKLHSQGVVVLVSFGGGTDSPYAGNPTTLGTQVAQWAVKNHLDGVDFDLENLGVGFVASGLTAAQTVQWMVTISNAARTVLGPSLYISHAPQAPYFGPIGVTTTWAGSTGGYSGVYSAAAGSIDFFLIQFYNQGATCYVDYNGLFKTSCTNFPMTSVSDINKSGVPLSAIVVGKLVTTADGGSGFVAPATLATFFAQAKIDLGWSTGCMAWVWQGAPTATWINAVYPGAATLPTAVNQNPTSQVPPPQNTVNSPPNQQTSQNTVNSQNTQVVVLTAAGASLHWSVLSILLVGLAYLV